jgi:predicted DNA-binding transcriptional regulator AlpA
VSRKRGALPFVVPTAPPDRGTYLTPEAVAALITGVSAAWVRRNVPGKIILGQRTVRWRERDVLEWLEARRTGTK